MILKVFIQYVTFFKYIALGVCQGNEFVTSYSLNNMINIKLFLMN